MTNASSFEVDEAAAPAPTSQSWVRWAPAGLASAAILLMFVALIAVSSDATPESGPSPTEQKENGPPPVVAAARAKVSAGCSMRTSSSVFAHSVGAEYSQCGRSQDSDSEESGPVLGLEETCEVLCKKGFSGKGGWVRCSSSPNADGVAVHLIHDVVPQCAAPGTCSSPLSNPSTTVDVADCAGRPEGAICTLRCQPGYEAQGVQVLPLACWPNSDDNQVLGGWKLQSSGDEMPEDALKCMPKKCEIPVSFRLDSVDVTECEGLTHHQMCTPKCKQALEPVGGHYAPLMCANGKFVGNWPDCKAVHVDDPKLESWYDDVGCHMPDSVWGYAQTVDLSDCLKGGTAKPSLPVGETCKMKCAPGYSGRSQTLKCWDRGGPMAMNGKKFRPGVTMLVCNPTRCTWDKRSKEFDYQDCRRVSYGSSCAVGCSAKNFWMPKDVSAPVAQMRCGETGRLEGAEPACQRMPYCQMDSKVLARLTSLQEDEGINADVSSCLTLNPGEHCNLHCEGTTRGAYVLKCDRSGVVVEPKYFWPFKTTMEVQLRKACLKPVLV